MALALKTAQPAQGAQWVRDAWQLFRQHPLAFTMMFAVFMFVLLMAAIVPVIGGVLQLMLVPLLALGFMVASQSALLAGPVRPSQYLEPLRAAPAQRRSLLWLCVWYGLATAGALALADLAADDGYSRLAELMRQANTPPAEFEALFAERGMVAGALIGSVLMTVISLVWWHAPALVHWGRQSAGQALFSSTLAVWRCRGAFLIYGLVWMMLMAGFAMVSGMLLAVLGLGGLMPMVAIPAGLFMSTLFYVSVIFTFNDSFGEVGPSAAAPPNG